MTESNCYLMYSTFAGHYSRLFGFVNHSKRSLFYKNLILPALKSEGRTLIDFCCGTGEHTSHFASYGFQVIGIDLSTDMLAVARRKHPSLRFEQGDIRALDSTRYRADVVICFQSSILHAGSLDNLKKVLNDFWYMLSPGGVLLFDILDKYGAHDGLEYVNEHVSEDGLLQFKSKWWYKGYGETIDLFTTYTVSEEGQVRDVHEHIELLATTIQDVTDWMQQIGFQVRRFDLDFQQSVEWNGSCEGAIVVGQKPL